LMMLTSFVATRLNRHCARFPTDSMLIGTSQQNLP